MRVARKHREGLNSSNPISGLSEVLTISSNGDHASFDRLFTLIYNDFRGLAKSYLAGESHVDTLQATALVNEAYLRLADQVEVDWKSPQPPACSRRHRDATHSREPCHRGETRQARRGRS